MFDCVYLLLFFSQMRYPDVKDYQKIPNYYGEMFRPQLPPSIRDNWRGNNQGEIKNT